MIKNEEKPLGKVTSKAYLYAYPKTRTGYGLSKLIYPDSRKDVLGTIKNEDLIDRNYFNIEEIKNDEGKIIKTKIFSKVDPLINSIGKKYKLNDFEKYVIKKILNSQGFRQLVGRTIDYKKENSEPLFKILCLFDILLIFVKGKKKIFKEKGVRLNFKNRNDYNRYVDNLDEILKDKTILDVSLKGIPIKKKNKDVLYEIENFSIMIIPESIQGKLKDGVTFVGRLFHHYDRMLKEIEKLPGIFTTVMKNLKN